MGTKISFRKALIALATLFFALPAAAQVPPLEKLDYKLLYDVTWNGLNIGRIRIKMKEDDANYSITIDTKTGGIARFFSSEKSRAAAEGRIQNGHYVPTLYTSHNDNGSQSTKITYNADGDIETLERVPASKSKKRAQVPREEANTATDPASAFFNLRRLLHDAMVQNARDVSTRSYDGVRLGEMLMHVVSPARVKINEKYESAINTVIARKPINGYSEKELKKFKEGDPTIHIFFSADGRFMPIKAEVQVGFGTIAATLAEIK
jgi:hypothetical protein